MPLRLKTAALSFNTFSHPIYRGLSLLLTLALMACAVAAQSDREAKHAAADELLTEGAKLIQKGTKESLEQAIEKIKEALPLLRSVNDQANEAVALMGIGRVYTMLGEKRKALDYYTQALPVYRAAGNRRGEAMADRHTGEAYIDLGEKQKALDYLAQALPLYRAISDRQGEAITLNSMALVHSELGEKQKALEYYEQSLLLCRAIGDRHGEAVTLNGIALLYSDLGQKQKALDHYAQALPLRREVKDRRGEAVTLNNIGKLYYDLGEQQKALDYYAQALPILRALGDPQGEALTLNNIGAAYIDLGEKQKALDYYTQALPIFQRISDRRGQAIALSNIGKVYYQLGERAKALDYHTQALALKRAIIDRQGEAVTLNNIAVAYEAAGERQKALDYYTQALAISHAVGDRTNEALTLHNIAILESNANRLDEARQWIEKALAIIETLRTDISNSELRSAYFATVHDYYEFYIDLLMRLHKERPRDGHDRTALQASERARARSLLESLAEANADIRQGVEPTLVERERALQRQLNTKAQEQMKLLASPHTDEQAKALAQEIDRLTTEFQQVETQIRQTSPRYAALTQPQPLTLQEIQTEVLDADTLLLEYSLGEKRSYLWAVTSTSIMSYELPKRDEIEAAARRVYDLLNARNQHLEGETQAQRKARIAQSDAQYAKAAVSLSRMVLAPVAARLGTKCLLIASDGALQYIPFGALSVVSSPSSVVKSKQRATDNGQRTTDEYQPLVVRYEIVSLPSASTLSALRREVRDRKPAVKTVAVLADPVFESDDERVGRNSGEAADEVRRRTPSANRRRDLPLDMEGSAEESGLRGAGLRIPRLPGTRLEAERILALVAASERKQAFDFAASRATATSVDLSQYRYLHFATHGFLNSLHPELSGIAFSMVDENGKRQDGFLRAHEVFNLRLPAELVVLSACRTGLGKEVKGEGLLGLTRGFMYAGAPRVVVSLWSVSDAATAELMTRFYVGMLKEGRRPAAALREAQLSLLNNKRWESPFYWAAFTLQGEWR